MRTWYGEDSSGFDVQDPCTGQPSEGIQLSCLFFSGRMWMGGPFEKHPEVDLVLRILLAWRTERHEALLDINCDMLEQQQRYSDLTC